MPRETLAAAPLTDDEEDVQEVRCAVTGAPIPAIPLWYAGVRVKFVSDAVRQKSAPLPRPEDDEDEDEDEEADSEEGEISLDDVDEGVAADEIEIDLGDADLDSGDEPEEDAEEAI